jgi:hypothetical protein
VADGVFQRRHEPLDISICVVRGRGGLLLVDRSSPPQGEEIREHVRELSADPVVAVVNTHTGFDHTFGNQVFADVPICGHDLAPVHLEAYETPMRAAWVAEGIEPLSARGGPSVGPRGPGAGACASTPRTCAVSPTPYWNGSTRRSDDAPTSSASSPHPAALLRLAGRVLIEVHDEWQVSERRYLFEASMALIDAQPADFQALDIAKEVAATELIAS